MVRIACCIEDVQAQNAASSQWCTDFETHYHPIALPADSPVAPFPITDTYESSDRALLSSINISCTFRWLGATRCIVNQLVISHKYRRCCLVSQGPLATKELINSSSSFDNIIPVRESVSVARSRHFTESEQNRVPSLSYQVRYSGWRTLGGVLVRVERQRSSISSWELPNC